MGEILIFSLKASAVGGSVTDHPGLYLSQKQSAFSAVLYSYLIRNQKLKKQEMGQIS